MTLWLCTSHTACPPTPGLKVFFRKLSYLHNSAALSIFNNMFLTILHTQFLLPIPPSYNQIVTYYNSKHPHYINFLISCLPSPVSAP